MKKLSLLVAVMACIILPHTQGISQTNLSVAYTGYDAHEVTTADTMHLDFEVHNHGPLAYSAGDTLYFSARLNGMFLGLNLLGTETGVVLQQNLGVGQSFIFPAGYLVGSETLLFFPGSDTLQVCIYAWGKGIAAVDLTPAFPGDTDSTDNVTCVTYNPAAHDDLGVDFLHYADGAITAEDTLRYAFEVSNHGRTTFKAGDTLYLSVRLNGSYFALNLLGTESAVVLTQDLGRGATFTYDPGYLLGSQTLVFFPGATTLESCLTLWGRGLAAVDLTPAFPWDDDSTDNVTCMTFDPTFVSVTPPSLQAIYPMPASEEVCLDLGKGQVERIELHSLAGQCVGTYAVKGTHMRIPVGSLPNGYYLLSLLGHEQAAQRLKISIQH